MQVRRSGGPEEQMYSFPLIVTPESDLEQFERLAASISSRFVRLQVEEIAPALTATLEQIAAALAVGSCVLLEFDDRGRVSGRHAASRSLSAVDGAPTTEPPWLIDWLLGQEDVMVSRPDDLPVATVAASARSARGQFRPILGVPISVGGQVICALVVTATSPVHRWRAPLVERLRLVTEILGVALQRLRQEHALRASLIEIKRLNAALEADNRYLQEEIKSYPGFDDIIGNSQSLRAALSRLGQVAPLNATVLLLGETGTGKELFARAIHDRSPRRTRPFVRVNCAALVPTLVESELFGHEKGAFTGASSLRQGRFELADGGTIFLDEIGDLPPDIQSKLLRVLQEGEFERVGSSRSRQVDARVIAATHHDLEGEVAAERFRADLYYRLNVFPIDLPPLRERPDDVPSLVWFFIHRNQRTLGRHITKIPQSVMQTLQCHSWPGNVRELENVIERAMICSRGDTLHLDETFARSKRKSHASRGEDHTLDSIQRAHIELVLSECGWRINGSRNAAERLGMHPNTLRFRMKKLGIAGPARRARIEHAST